MADEYERRRRRRDDDDEDERPRRGRRDDAAESSVVEFYDHDSRYERARKQAEYKRATGRRGRPLTRGEFRLCQLLDQAEALRRQLADVQNEMAGCLEYGPCTADTYALFLKSGGVTGDDFEVMIRDGGTPQPVKQRGHLRLVASKKRKRPIPRQMLNAKANPSVT